VRDELVAETRANVSQELIARAWKRIVLTHEVSLDSIAKLVTSAQAVGFLRDVPDLARLIEKP
jgi:NitT/TauT family transport system substrate-binding protein